MKKESIAPGQDLFDAIERIDAEIKLFESLGSVTNISFNGMSEKKTSGEAGAVQLHSSSKPTEASIRMTTHQYLGEEVQGFVLVIVGALKKEKERLEKALAELD